jgi:hypothetical protein
MACNMPPSLLGMVCKWFMCVCGGVDSLTGEHVSWQTDCIVNGNLLSFSHNQLRDRCFAVQFLFIFFVLVFFRGFKF